MALGAGRRQAGRMTDRRRGCRIRGLMTRVTVLRGAGEIAVMARVAVGHCQMRTSQGRTMGERDRTQRRPPSDIR